MRGILLQTGSDSVHASDAKDATPHSAPPSARGNRTFDQAVASSRSPVSGSATILGFFFFPPDSSAPPRPPGVPSPRLLRRFALDGQVLLFPAVTV